MGDNPPVRRNRSTRRHIEEWIASVPLGTQATVAEICNFASQEYKTPFAQEYPSPGAVAARLFPSNPRSELIPGIEQLPSDGGPMRVQTVEVQNGGIKVAVPYTSHNTYGLMIQVRGVMEQLKEQLGPHWPQAKSLIRNFLSEDDPTPEHDLDNLPF